MRVPKRQRAPRPVVAAEEGDLVRARPFNWDDRYTDYLDVQPFDGDPSELIGVLRISYVAALDYWQFNVNGHGVEPETIVRVQGA